MLLSYRKCKWLHFGNWKKCIKWEWNKITFSECLFLKNKTPVLQVMKPPCFSAYFLVKLYLKNWYIFTTKVYILGPGVGGSLLETINSDCKS